MYIVIAAFCLTAVQVMLFVVFYRGIRVPYESFKSTECEDLSAMLSALPAGTSVYVLIGRDIYDGPDSPDGGNLRNNISE